MLKELNCSMQKVIFEDLGKLDYKVAWDYQEKLLSEKVKRKQAEKLVGSPLDINQLPSNEHDEETVHHLLFVEHPPVYTLGKSGRMENVLISREEMDVKGISFFKTNRGGDITFHGPGQVVGYPIFDLEKFYTDIGRYLRNLEEVIIRTMADYGLKGERSSGETGVWIDSGVKGQERKICAMGVRCSRWVTMHGFAFNVNTDLDYFNYIVPCGIENKSVTSLAKELRGEVSIAEVQKKLKTHFTAVFDVTFR
jgi:lipoyl(octanoyl) transferase